MPPVAVFLALLAARPIWTADAVPGVPAVDPGARGPTADVTPAVAPPPVASPADVPPPVARSSDLYRIGAGDTLTVQVYGEPALTGAFPVGDAGALDFPLLGAVKVEGLTVVEVAAQLCDRLTPGYLLHPNVTVWVSDWRSQPVQVLGAVARPGTYFLRGPTTVLQILSAAGGVSGAGVNEVRITHGADDQVVVLPYDQLLDRSSEELALVAGDTIFVPQSLVSILGQVGQPGEIAFREGITLSQSIALVGGALPTADLARVYILRGDQRIPVNLRKILSGRVVDAPLEPGDRIFVRESVF